MTKSLGMFEAKLISSLPRLGGGCTAGGDETLSWQRRKWKDKKERNTPQKIKMEDKNILLCCGMLITTSSSDLLVIGPRSDHSLHMSAADSLKDLGEN